MNIADQIMRRADRAFAEASGRILIEDLSPMERKAIEDDMERKARYVRTPAGVRRFKRPIGAIILPRGGSLDQIRIKDPVFKGFDLVEDRKGNLYDVGKDPASGGKYVVLKHNTWDDQIPPQDSLDKALEALNEKLGGGTNSDREEGEKPAPKAKTPAPKKTPSKEPSSGSESQTSAPSKGNTSTAEIVDGKFVITTPDGKKHTRTATGKKPYTHALIRKNKEGSGSDRYFVNFATDEGKVHRESRIGAADRAHNEIIELPTSGNDAPKTPEPQGDAPASDDNVASSDPRKRSAKFKRAADNMDRAMDAVDSAKTEDDYRRALVDLEKSTVEMEDYIKSKGSEEDFARSALPKIERAKAKARSQIKRLEAKRKDQAGAGASDKPKSTMTPEKFVENLLHSDRLSYEALSEKGKAAYRAEVQKHIDKGVHDSNSRYLALEAGQKVDRDERARNTFAGNGLREYNRLTDKQKQAVFSDIDGLMDPQDALRKQVTGKAPANAQKVARERAMERQGLSQEGQRRYDSARRSGSTHQEAIDAVRTYDRNRDANRSDATRPKPKAASKGAQGSPERDAFIESHPKIKDVTDYHKPKLRDMSEKNFRAYVAAVEGGKSPNSIGPIMDRIDAGASWNPVTEKWVGQNSTKRPTSPTPTADTSASDAADAAVRDRVQRMKDADRSKGRTNPYTSSLKPHQKDEVDALTPGEYATYMNQRDMGRGHMGAMHALRNQPKSGYKGSMDAVDSAIKRARKNLSPKMSGKEQLAEIQFRERELQQAHEDLSHHSHTMPEKLDQMSPDQKRQQAEMQKKTQEVWEAESVLGRKRAAALEKARKEEAERTSHTGETAVAEREKMNAIVNTRVGGTPDERVAKYDALIKEMDELGKSITAIGPEFREARRRLHERQSDALKAQGDQRRAEEVAERQRQQAEKSKTQATEDAARDQKNREAREGMEAAQKFGNPAMLIHSNQALLEKIVKLGRSGKNPAPHLPEARERLAAINDRLSWTDDELGGYHRGAGKAESDIAAARHRANLRDQKGKFEKAIALMESQSQPKGTGRFAPKETPSTPSPTYHERPGDPGDAPFRRGASKLREAGITDFRPNDARRLDGLNTDQQAEVIRKARAGTPLTEAIPGASLSTEDIRRAKVKLSSVGTGLSNVNRVRRADSAHRRIADTRREMAEVQAILDDKNMSLTATERRGAQRGLADAQKEIDTLVAKFGDPDSSSSDAPSKPTSLAEARQQYNAALSANEIDKAIELSHEVQRFERQALGQNPTARRANNADWKRRRGDLEARKSKAPVAQDAPQERPAESSSRGADAAVAQERVKGVDSTVSLAKTQAQKARRARTEKAARDHINTLNSTERDLNRTLERSGDRMPADQRAEVEQALQEIRAARAKAEGNIPLRDRTHLRPADLPALREEAESRRYTIANPRVNAAVNLFNEIPSGTDLPNGRRYEQSVDMDDVYAMDNPPSVPELNRAIDALEKEGDGDYDDELWVLRTVRDSMKEKIDRDRAETEAANTSLFGDDLSIPEPTPARPQSAVERAQAELDAYDERARNAPRPDRGMESMRFHQTERQANRRAERDLNEAMRQVRERNRLEGDVQRAKVQERRDATPKTPVDPSIIKGADAVLVYNKNTQGADWHRVKRVNKTTVTVDGGGGGMDDFRFSHDRVVGVRKNGETTLGSTDAPSNEPTDGPYRRGADRIHRAGLTGFTPNQARQVDEMTRDQWEEAQAALSNGESFSDVLGRTAVRNRRDPMAPPPVSRDEVRRRLAERRAAREAASRPRTTRATSSWDSYDESKRPQTDAEVQENALERERQRAERDARIQREARSAQAEQESYMASLRTRPQFSRGSYNREAVVLALVEGNPIQQVFGRDRQAAQESLRSIVRSFKPTDQERTTAAWGNDQRLANKVRAYDEGVTALRSIYNIDDPDLQRGASIGDTPAPRATNVPAGQSEDRTSKTAINIGTFGVRSEAEARQMYANTPRRDIADIPKGGNGHIGNGIWVKRCPVCGQAFKSVGAPGYSSTYAKHVDSHGTGIAIPGYNVGMLS